MNKPTLNFKIDKARKLARRMKFQGMDISIETDKGQVRHWHDEHTGEYGETKMRYPYGYIRRTDGLDGQHVDCFIGPEEEAEEAYIIHQRKKPEYKYLDEDKVMLGFESAKQAKAAYLMHFDSPKFFGSMDRMPVDDFREAFVKKALDEANDGAPFWQHPGDVLPPPSVDDPMGVDHFLGRIGNMSDKDVESLASDVWGNGYQYREAQIEDIRDEMIGFLQDQRDRLARLYAAQQAQPQLVAPSPSPDLSTSSPTSIDGIESEAAPSNEESFNDEESTSPSFRSS